ncbi:hypothetical protein [Paenirhodobacter populi]|nr:hypothetical protein [Sinirhodobacter populi]
MTNPVAIGLALLLLLALALDGLANHWAATLFLAIKVTELIDWVAFWR